MNPKDEGDPELRYHISGSKYKPIDMSVLVQRNTDDPAYKVWFIRSLWAWWAQSTYQKFIPKLQDHLFGHLIDQSFDGDTHDEFSDADRNNVHLVSSNIYTVKTFQLYYTTYDLQCKYDTISPTSHPDVMVRSPETGTDASPYWYAHVLGMYHRNVWTTNLAVKDGDNMRQMDFLFVRWLGEEPGYRYGFRQAHLPKIGFVLSSDNYAFGFLDPRHVICGCHLEPAFHGGRTSELLPTARSEAQIIEGGAVDDWANFYVNVYNYCELSKD